MARKAKTTIPKITIRVVKKTIQPMPRNDASPLSKPSDLRT